MDFVKGNNTKKKMVSIQKYILIRLITYVVVTEHLIQYFIIIHYNIMITK